MTYEEVRKALLDDSVGPRKEIHTNDDRVFLVDAVERWALGPGRLVILEGAGQNTISIRNIASIGIPSGRRRSRRRRAWATSSGRFRPCAGVRSTSWTCPLRSAAAEG